MENNHQNPVDGLPPQTNIETGQIVPPTTIIGNSYEPGIPVPPTAQATPLNDDAPMYTAADTEKLKKFPLALLIAGALYAVSGLTTAMTMATTSYEVATNLSGVTFWVGVLAAIVTGVGVATLILRMGGMGHNRFMRAGMILAILSVVAGLLTLVPAIICFFVGSKSPSERTNKPLSKGAKIGFCIGGFIAGVVPGLVVAIILGFITSMRACELSSSKCL